MAGKRTKRQPKNIELENVNEKIEVLKELTIDNRFNIDNEENLKEILYFLSKLAEEYSESKSMLLIIKTIESLVIEYYEVSRRILQEVNSITQRDIYDDLTLVKANENIDKLIMHRSEIKDKIIRAAMQLEKIKIEREKQLLMKEKIHGEAFKDIYEFIEPEEM